MLFLQGLHFDFKVTVHKEGLPGSGIPNNSKSLELFHFEPRI